MARLIAALIRHGDYYQLPDTPSAHQPFPLNVEGAAQAEGAAGILREVMAAHSWTLDPVIDSSRMLRAWQTARIIAQKMAGLFPVEASVESFDELAERGLGSAANLTVAQIRDIVQRDPRFPDPPEDWKSNSGYQLPLQGAESLLQAGERVAAHLIRRMKALAEISRRDVLKLFVGHGAAFRHAAFHLGVLEFEQISQFSMYHGRPVFLEYLADTQWHHIEGEWKIRNSRSHFLD